MNHKRRKPKSSRAGCLLCKPHKHQRAKNSFHNLTVQDQRDQQSSRQVPPPGKRKKNTRRWCGGKEGREHQLEWWDRYRGFTQAYDGTVFEIHDWRLRCTVCGKELGVWNKFARPPRAEIMKFPGWERFQDGPPQ